MHCRRRSGYKVTLHSQNMNGKYSMLEPIVYDHSKMNLKLNNIRACELESRVFGQLISGRFL